MTLLNFLPCYSLPSFSFRNCTTLYTGRSHNHSKFVNGETALFGLHSWKGCHGILYLYSKATAHFNHICKTGKFTPITTVIILVKYRWSFKKLQWDPWRFSCKSKFISIEVYNKVLTELSMTVITPNGEQLLGNSIARFWMGDGGITHMVSCPHHFWCVGEAVLGEVTKSVLQTVHNMYDTLQRTFLCSLPYTNLECSG